MEAEDASVFILMTQDLLITLSTVIEGNSPSQEYRVPQAGLALPTWPCKSLKGSSVLPEPRLRGLTSPCLPVTPFRQPPTGLPWLGFRAHDCASVLTSAVAWGGGLLSG